MRRTELEAVVAPHLATRRFGEEPHLPDVYAENTEDPYARTADVADLHPIVCLRSTSRSRKAPKRPLLTRDARLVTVP
jgi:hypothetical protein